MSQCTSELLELFLSSLCLLYLQYIETDSLAQRTALTHNHQITNLHVSEEEKGMCTHLHTSGSLQTTYVYTRVVPEHSKKIIR